MPNLFGFDIAGIVANSIAAAGGVLDATLTKYTPGTRTGGSLTAGTNPTSASYACKGFMDSFDKLSPNEVSTEATAVVSLLGKTINSGAIAPAAGDVVVIEGSTFTVIKVTRDPAAALNQCQVS